MKYNLKQIVSDAEYASLCPGADRYYGLNTVPRLHNVMAELRREMEMCVDNEVLKHVLLEYAEVKSVLEKYKGMVEYGK